MPVGSRLGASQLDADNVAAVQQFIYISRGDGRSGQRLGGDLFFIHRRRNILGGVPTVGV